jgi:hypothetical protein
MTRTIRNWVVVAAVVALLAAGCSAGDDESSAPTTTPGGGTAQQARCSASDAPSSGAAILLPRVFAVSQWKLDKTNTYAATGCLFLDGKPVSGARIRIDNYAVPTPTTADGSFTYPLDATLPQQRTVRVMNAAEASVGGKPVSDEGRSALTEASAPLTVRYRLNDLRAEPVAEGIRIRGRATFDDGKAPPPIVLFAYQLTGTVRGPDGKPVEGARVTTRTLDGELFSLSSPSDAQGRYSSFFFPSGEAANAVGMIILVAAGDETWELAPNEVVFFPKLKSAVLDVDLPPANFPMARPEPRGVKGAVYEGLLVGIAVDGKPVKPVSSKWVDEQGDFELVVPKRLAGQKVSFWQSELYAFSETAAKPGAAVDLGHYPTTFPAEAPRNLDTLTLPG